MIVVIKWIIESVYNLINDNEQILSTFYSSISFLLPCEILFLHIAGFFMATTIYDLSDKPLWSLLTHF